MPARLHDTPSAGGRRGHLAAAAAELFQERGYQSVSVDELAERAGLSIGGMYRYISSKSDLLVTVCEDIYGELHDELVDAAAAERHTADKLRAAMRLYLESAHASAERILLMYREYRHLPGEAQQRYKRSEQAIAGVFAGLVRAGIDDGSFRPADPFLLGWDIVLLGHLPALKGWAVRDRTPLDVLVAHHVDTVLGSLTAGGSPPTSTDGRGGTPA